MKFVRGTGEDSSERKAARKWTHAPALAVAFLLACVAASCSLRNSFHADPSSDIPTARVQQGDVQLHVYTTGEFRATQSQMLIAPPVGGGNLQIVHLDPTGTRVKKGDVVMAFDPSEQEYILEQNRSNYEQASEEIVAAQDDAAVQTAQDQDALLKAKFAVRQAELQVSQNELVSSIDAQKNVLLLDEAKRALAQLQQDILSHSASNQATIALGQQKADKAKLAMDEAEQNIEKMQVRSPMDGLVVVQQNENASGGIFFSGMTLPDYQEGDEVNPGDSVAEVVDISKMEIAAYVNENERTNVQVGEPVEVQVDAVPGIKFAGKVKTVAGTSGGFFGSGPNNSFAVTVELLQTDPRLRPGFTVHLTILGEHLTKALTVPREALFQKDAESFVYVQRGSGFVQQDVKIRYLTDALAVIEGISAGTVVAEVNPEASPAAGAQTKLAGPPGPAPGPGAR